MGRQSRFEFKDILQVQFEIVKQISTALRLRLTGEEQKQIAARYTNDASAYDAYIEGRFHWSRFTREEIVKAIGHFRRHFPLIQTTLSRMQE
jgi:hypothetical protein